MSMASDISTISSSLNAIKNAIIDKGVTPLGDITTYAEAITQIQGDESGVETNKYGCTISNLLGDVDVNGKLQITADTSEDIVFNGVKDVGDYALYYKYSQNLNLTHGVSFPDLESVTGMYAMGYCFEYTRITSISLPKLKTVNAINGMDQLCRGTAITSFSMPEVTSITGIYAGRGLCNGCTYLTSFSAPKLTTANGNYCLYYLLQGTKITSFSLPELVESVGNYSLGYSCYNCTLLETVYLPKLSDISGQWTLGSAFYNCLKVKDIYFNGLTTTSFGSYVNQFNNMFGSTTGSAATGGCTVHFPSNLSSTISGLTGYPTFGGDSNYINLAFDLPATT